MDFTFAVRSDLFELPGRDEDGELAVGTVWYVIAEAADGRRWSHSMSFKQHGMVDYEEGRFPGIINCTAEAQAEALCERITKAVAAGRRLDEEHWTQIDPCYGSEAYQRLDDRKFFRNREIYGAFETGEIGFREAFDAMAR